jgi:hypothetical protein
VTLRACPGHYPGARGALAQLAEQRTFNPRVLGSIPRRPTSDSRLTCSFTLLKIFCLSIVDWSVLIMCSVVGPGQA